ncbi:MAG: tetratricopeptide repeat protein [Nitrospirota bacterium]
MKLTMKLLALFFGMLLLGNAAYAESPREQLKQMVEQLQKSPTDNALREKIIKLAQEIKPAPAVPEEARRHFIKATTLQTEAKNPDDYDLPIQEYRQALLLAPWWSDAYFNLATAFELKLQYAEAIQNLKFSILASPEGPDARVAQDKIYALEAKQDKLTSAAGKVARQRNQEEEWLKKLDGARFVRPDHSNYTDGGSVDWRDIYTVHGNKVYESRIIDANSDQGAPAGSIYQFGDKNGYIIVGRDFLIPKDDESCGVLKERCLDEIQTISEDGSKITERRTRYRRMKEEIFLREK